MLGHQETIPRSEWCLPIHQLHKETNNKPRKLELTQNAEYAQPWRPQATLEAEYCIQFVSPKVFIKTRMDVVKHLDTGCYVKGTNKHKYTCLNKACLLHSWICIKHTKENRPLLEAHHKEATNGNQMMPFLRPTTVHTGFSYTCYSKYLNKGACQ